MKSSRERERESAIAAQHHLPDLAVTTLPPFYLATKLGQEDGSSNKATEPEMEALIEEARLEVLNASSSSSIHGSTPEGQENRRAPRHGTKEDKLSSGALLSEVQISTSPPASTPTGATQGRRRTPRCTRFDYQDRVPYSYSQ
jgi:hypothetical protein